MAGQAQTQKPPSSSPNNDTERIIPKWRDALAGAFAGMCSKTAMAPIERIKLLLQLQAYPQHHNNAWQVARAVYIEQGVWSFWRGNLPSVLRTSGTAALNFSTMDYYKRLIHRAQPILESSPRRRKFVTSLVSGGMAGATATTLLYPVEFLRTRMAMDLECRQRRVTPHMHQVVLSIVKSDGIRGLYQGYGIAVAGSIVFRVLYLGGYDALKTEWLYYKQQQQQQRYSNSEDESLTWLERIVGAQFVSLTAGTLCYPLDSVRRRMMMQAGVPIQDRRYRHSLHCFRHVWHHEGWRGFYLGLAPNLVRSVGGAILLVAYDSFKDALTL